MRIPAPFTVLILLYCVSPVRADEPLPPPTHYEIHSPSHKFIAALDPKTGMSVSAVTSSEALWKSTNWFQVAFLADDGDHFITGYGGMNLIPQDYTKDLVLVTFWKRDQKIRDVTVGELFPNTRVLKKTVSHYHWGSITGITNSTLIVTRCDNKVLKFNVTTGQILK